MPCRRMGVIPVTKLVLQVGFLICELAGCDRSSDTPLGTSDLFNEHFGPQPSILSAENISAAERDDWKSAPTSLTGFGTAVELRPGEASPTGDTSAAQTRVSFFD